MASHIITRAFVEAVWSACSLSSDDSSDETSDADSPDHIRGRLVKTRIVNATASSGEKLVEHQKDGGDGG